MFVTPSRSPGDKRKCQCSTTSAELNDYGYLPSGAPRRCCVRSQNRRNGHCRTHPSRNAQGSLERLVRLLRPRLQGLQRVLGALQKARGAPLTARHHCPLRDASLRAADGRTI